MSSTKFDAEATLRERSQNPASSVRLRARAGEVRARLSPEVLLAVEGAGDSVDGAGAKR